MTPSLPSLLKGRWKAVQCDNMATDDGIQYKSGDGDSEDVEDYTG